MGEPWSRDDTRLAAGVLTVSMLPSAVNPWRRIPGHGRSGGSGEAVCTVSLGGTPDGAMSPA